MSQMLTFILFQADKLIATILESQESVDSLDAICDTTSNNTADFSVSEANAIADKIAGCSNDDSIIDIDEMLEKKSSTNLLKVS